MSAETPSDDRWILETATESDIDELMGWFPEPDDINSWGGPSFRYPFTRNTFIEDIRWNRMESFSLRDAAGRFAAFGQLYKRNERIHLARLVVNRGMRRQGTGKRLIHMLMKKGQALFNCDEYSLFVFQANIAAIKCYESMGFILSDYPEDMPFAEVCYFLTRPV